MNEQKQKIDDGGPAFPTHGPTYSATINGKPWAKGMNSIAVQVGPHDANEFTDRSDEPSYQGMSTRTLLAGMAMQGIVSSDVTLAAIGKERPGEESMELAIAVEAVKFADALLAQLRKDAEGVDT